ncbi:TetR-like C-terminal domain-containing protein [Neobacillus cucumis]|uniref:TetR-like C-terminal domain-containing protein n=1 Tax=Neobacillus cucumis TaxID=1740721 RepID=UPI00285364D7|nr:TetR-like C-terminal domain-containing protein [Neobacillus cucumis]MDR4947142.1 TetR-like C-terminal domain-containing protein [Neobacillus cucumis]
MEWVDATKTYFEYFESNYLFFSTMLASKAAPSFRRKFLEFLIEAFKDEVDKTKNHSLNADIIVKFAANAYVGVLESWLKEGMPYPPYVMAKEMGILLERIVDAHKFYMRQGFTESPKYFIKMLPKSD